MSAIVNLFYIYDPWLFHFLRMAFVVGIIGLLFLVYQIYQKKLSDGIFIPKKSLLIILGLILFSAIPMVIHGTKDFSVIIMYCKSLILFILGIIIYNLFYSKDPHLVIRDFKIGISIQSLIGFIALLGFPFMVEFTLSCHILLPKFYGSEQEYRLYNLTSSAFFQLSIFYLMLFHFLLAYNKKHNNIHSIFLFLMLFIGLISGRTFLLLSLVSLALYFKWRYIPAVLLFLTICIFLSYNYSDNKYVAHALEPLINLIYGAGTISSSTDTLVKKHLFIPELKQILFGDGYYYAPKGGYYGHTDSGFLRQILYGGIGYLALCFAFTAYFIIQIAQSWFNSSWKFILSTLALLTILNIKADTYAYPGIMMVLLMFLSLFNYKGNALILFKNGEK